MTTSPTPKTLDVLLVEDERATAEALCAVLEARGHRVQVCGSAEEAATQPEADVVVTDVRLVEASGLELLADLRRRGQRARAVVMTGLPSFETCREALHLGASEVLAKPFKIEELVAAVEGDARDLAPARTLQPTRVALSDATPALVARRLAAFGLEVGAPLSARARLASAAAEIVQNCLDHAFDEAGEDIVLEAWLDGSSILARISDEGRGFDVVSEDLAGASSAFDGGLARACSLVEDLQLDTRPGRGTRVTLRVFAASSRFDNELDDLSDEDFFAPGEASRVLETLGEPGGHEADQLPAHLAVCVGRLLAGPDPRSILRNTLGS